MTARFFVDHPLQAGDVLDLPPGAARHVQVLRAQPGDVVLLFNGQGGEWQAEVTAMGRSHVQVRLLAHHAAHRELRLQVTLALAMPANDRMDDLVEKASELGVAAIQPLVSERSVLRLSGERAERKQQHWLGVARAACEQSGRTRVPVIEPVRSLAAWLGALPEPSATSARWILSFSDATPVAPLPAGVDQVCVLSGPEGGLSPAEEQLARTRGFVPKSLGPRVLRADTAPLATLAVLAAGALG